MLDNFISSYFTDEKSFLIPHGRNNSYSKLLGNFQKGTPTNMEMVLKEEYILPTDSCNNFNCAKNKKVPVRRLQYLRGRPCRMTHENRNKMKVL